MAGELSRDEGWMAMLKTLGREEILDVLSKGLCKHCEIVLQTRVRTLDKRKLGDTSISSDYITTDRANYGKKSNSKPIWRSENTSESASHCRRDAFVSPMSVVGKKSSSKYSKHDIRLDNAPNWTSLSIDDGLPEEKERIRFGQVVRKNDFSCIERRSKPIWRSENTSELASRCRRDAFVSPMSVDGKKSSSKYSKHDIRLDDGPNWTSSSIDDGLSEEHERIRFGQLVRKKNFDCFERSNGKLVNVLEGLELHTKVFNFPEQRTIVDYIFMLQRMGQNGQLRARTYSEPRKWMRGKGRVTIQFGCCYNYAVDKDGNPPGIVRDEEVDPLPPLFKQMIKRMIRWQVLPASCVPDSCIVNIYEEGDCIPPHIDHHDFVRPFCTVSFLSECKILFGANLKVVGPGEFDGPFSIPLPVGSVLIFNGNGADVAKHCVPGVPSRRISITFRKMDHSRLPYRHVPETELMGIKPLIFSPPIKSSMDLKRYEYKEATPRKSSIDFEQYKYKGETDDESPTSAEINKKADSRQYNEFPPHSPNYGSRQRKKRHYL